MQQQKSHHCKANGGILTWEMPTAGEGQSAPSPAGKLQGAAGTQACQCLSSQCKREVRWRFREGKAKRTGFASFTPKHPSEEATGCNCQEGSSTKPSLEQGSPQHNKTISASCRAQHSAEAPRAPTSRLILPGLTYTAVTPSREQLHLCLPSAQC